MNEKRQAVDDATGEMQNAAVALIRHAHDVAAQSREAGATEIDKGWSANVRAMLPMLAKEGSKFVKASEKKEEVEKKVEEVKEEVEKKVEETK